MRLPVNKYFIATKDLEDILEEGRVYKVEQEDEHCYFLWGRTLPEEGIIKNFLKLIGEQNEWLH